MQTKGNLIPIIIFRERMFYIPQSFTLYIGGSKNESGFLPLEILPVLSSQLHRRERLLSLVYRYLKGCLKFHFYG